MKSLERAVSGFVRRGRLLVATDFDGTLSHIVDRPEDATPVDGAIESLVVLAGLDRVHVAMVSGRGLEDLRSLIAPPPDVLLVGEHGATGRGGADGRLPEVERAAQEMHVVVSGYPGAWIELKNRSFVVHTRQVAEDRKGELLAEVGRGLQRVAPEAHVTHGNEVVDVLFGRFSKGRAVAALRKELAADAVFFAGDDVTDETVFTTLAQGDVGVKVGDGQTAAEFRVDSPADMVRVLRSIAKAYRALFEAD